ncbi:unnamed protein product [Darwinula stevensoni]|uniref:Uncharacterized protein n=1 Tax=Darwinula stevensoni TaxID=69355 RepID=A0A7R9FNM6_9CRUS|nr:unnamed protein product [Darwinula stevensoni]CAG0896613.1 unnamed protein product [Darwinula stevensoni]
MLTISLLVLQNFRTGKVSYVLAWKVTLCQPRGRKTLVIKEKEMAHRIRIWPDKIAEDVYVGFWGTVGDIADKGEEKLQEVNTSSGSLKKDTAGSPPYSKQSTPCNEAGDLSKIFPPSQGEKEGPDHQVPEKEAGQEDVIEMDNGASKQECRRVPKAAPRKKHQLQPVGDSLGEPKGKDLDTNEIEVGERYETHWVAYQQGNTLAIGLSFKICNPTESCGELKLGIDVATGSLSS